MKFAIPFICDPDGARATEWLHTLQKAMPDERIAFLDELDAEAKAQCDFAIVANPSPEALRQLPNLRWVQSLWAGVERLIADMPDARFAIVRLVDPQLAATMSQAVLAWTLYLHRDMPTYGAQQKRHEWKVHPYRRAEEVSVGVLGLGELGQPLTPQTTGLLDARHLAALPPGAALINFSRGPVIDDDALRSALDTQHIRHAVLDVFNEEPLRPTSWHWDHPAVTVLPHISAPTDPTTAARIVAANVQRFRHAGTIPAGVDRARGY